MKTILVVDDMAVFREPIEAMLREGGYQTRGASSGRDALAFMKDAVPDLVLLDLSMPEPDGLQVLSMMRANHRLMRVPVIILSSAGDKERIRKVATFGVSGYVLKSQFSSEDILERLRRELESPPPSPSLPEETQQRPASTDTSQGSTVAASAPKLSATFAGGDTAGHVLGVDKQAASDPVAALKSLPPVMTRDGVLAKIKACAELKGLSPVVGQILRLTGSASCTAEHIARVISQDPGVSMKILRLANSSVYARGDAVDSVQRAVVRIGLERIRQTVLNISVVERFSSIAFQQHLNTQQFWEHSIATGVIAAGIVQATAQKGSDAAFTTGLLHDVGRVVFAEQLAEQYLPVVDAARSLGLPLEQAESRMLLVNHAEAMEVLLRGWGFPHSLFSPILTHHHSIGGIRAAAPDQLREALVLSLANRLAHALLLGSSGNDAIYPTDEICDFLRIGGKLIGHIESEAGRQTNEMKFAMLAQSAESWLPRADQVRSELQGPFRPLFVGAHPEVDAFRIFASTLAGHEAAERPNIAIIHAPRTIDQPPMIIKLHKLELEAGIQNLPVLLLSQAGQDGIDPALSSERNCTRLATPFATSRFIAAFNKSLTTPNVLPKS